jgi:hypothetical protein
MINQLSQEKWQEHQKLFLEGISTPQSLELVAFHPVQLPVVISEAYVKLRSVQDYSVLSLLILRLFDAGIHSQEAIRSICGLSAETVRIYIEKEMYLLEHIDPKTNQLTELGRQTLALNADPSSEKARSCQNFDSVLRLHIDPLTASLIPQYLEWEQPDNFEPNPAFGDFLKPRASASIDDAFRQELRERLTREINQRKDEYTSLDTFKNADILNHVERLHPILIFYRWGYLAKFKGMRCPLIVLTGRRSIENVNADSVAAGVKSQMVAMPIAISRSDHAYLRRHGIRLDQAMVRDDDCFEELLEAVAALELTLPTDDGEDNSL